MHVTINAQAHDIAANSTVAALIEHLALQNKRLAIEVNKALVPRSLFIEHQLHENDQIEIVQAIGGG
jgi:thiamine biosynthesis protein ThiS